MDRGLQARTRELLADVQRESGDDLPRNVVEGYVFEISRTYRQSGLLVDLGGGVALKNAVLARLGMKVIVIDLFEEYYSNSPSGSYDITKRKAACVGAGVEMVDADFFEMRLGDIVARGSVDVVTSLHVFEHLHRSPRPLVREALSVLKRGGMLHIEVPNAANLRKRLNLLRGTTNYPDFHSFYDKDVWHGHVREYTIGDLKALGRDTGQPYTIYGRNFFGGVFNRLPSLVRVPADLCLVPFPGFCGSLFLDVTSTR